MKLRTKIIIIVVIIILVLGVWGVRRWWQIREVQKILEWQEKELEILRADTIGGDTPEETWQMFLQALRNEDLDLASKYFVLKKQEEWKGNLVRTREAGDLSALMQDITVAPWQEIIFGEVLAEYEIKDSSGETTAYIIMEKNINNKWKIRSL